jgi:hypothetical protein
MTSIFKNEYFNITKDTNNVFTIEYHTKLDFMIPYSLYQEETIDNKTLINKKYFHMKISRSDIITMETYMKNKMGQLSYIDCNNLIIQIGNQIKEIERNGLTVPFIEPKDIVIINNYFIYLGDNIVPIKTDNSITIVKPYQKNMFFSPEMLNIKKLPETISNKNWIYSLGMLCIYALSKNKKINNKNRDELLSLIQDIEATKLYFCIERCIENKYTKRHYYFI